MNIPLWLIWGRKKKIMTSISCSLKTITQHFYNCETVVTECSKITKINKHFNLKIPKTEHTSIWFIRCILCISVSVLHVTLNSLRFNTKQKPTCKPVLWATTGPQRVKKTDFMYVCHICMSWSKHDAEFECMALYTIHSETNL